jgi:hypothetical protein
MGSDSTGHFNPLKWSRNVRDFLNARARNRPALTPAGEVPAIATPRTGNTPPSTPPPAYREFEQQGSPPPSYWRTGEPTHTSPPQRFEISSSVATIGTSSTQATANASLPPPPVNRATKPLRDSQFEVSIGRRGEERVRLNLAPLRPTVRQLPNGVEIGRDGVERVDLSVFQQRVRDNEVGGKK